MIRRYRSYQLSSKLVQLESPGAIDHVMSRGDRREDIFHDDVDRQSRMRDYDLGRSLP
jgi:hypothetical protein